MAAGTACGQSDSDWRRQTFEALLLEDAHAAIYYTQRITVRTAEDEAFYLEAELLRNPAYPINTQPKFLNGLKKRPDLFLYVQAQYNFLNRQYKQTLTALQKISQTPSITYGKVELLKGRAWLDLNKPDSALLYLTHALTIFRQDSTAAYLQIAKVHNNLGRTCRRKNMLDEAVRHYQLAINILQNSPLAKWDDLGKVFNNLAIAYNELGEYNAAEQQYLETIRLKEKHSTDSLIRATTYINVASFYYEYGNFLKSQTYYKKAASLIDSTRLQSYQLLGDYYNNYGSLLMDMREHALAEKSFHESLRFYKRSGADKLKLLTPTLNMASCLIQTHQPELARLVLQESKSIVEDLPDPQADRVTYWMICGDLAIEERKLKDADSCYLQAKKTLEAFPRLPLNNYVYTLSEIGSVARLRNDPARAIAFHRKALNRLQASELHDKQLLVAVYNNIGIAYAAMSQADSAKHFFKLALRENLIQSDAPLQNNQPFFSDAFALILTHYNLALLGYLDFQKSSKQENLLAILPSIEAGMQLIRLERDRMSSEHDKIGLGVSVANFYDLSVKIYKELFRLTGKAEYYESLILSVERSRQQVMMAGLRIDNIEAFAGVTNRLMNHEQQVNYSIRHLTAQLSDELSLGEDATGELIQEYDQALVATRQQFQTLTDSLKNNLPDYYNLKYNTTLAGAADIENDILADNPQKALVQYYVADSILLIIVQHSTLKAVLQVPYADIGKHVTSLRNHIKYKLPEWRIPAAWLYERLIKPVDSVLAGLRPSIRELIIIPDRELVYLPFETLVQETTGRLLVERTEITYAFSSTLLWQKATDRSHVTARHKFIGFVPTFEQNGTITQYPLRTGGELVSFAPLPSTPLEVRQITTLLNKKGIGTQTLEGNEASEASFKLTSLSEYRFIHLATHGFVNMEDPDRSGLAFSKVDAGEDGILFSGEIYGVKLNADLVCLSACETGLGKIYRGEGLIGLSRSFLYAGARNLVVSLWSVDDESTSEWMTKFYSALANGERNAVAVRKAKLELIRNKKYKHPYYWAPFILIGS